jgi:hypothetical protein
LAAAGCQSEPAPPESGTPENAATPPAQEPSKKQSNVTVHGSAILPGKEVQLAKVLAEPQKYAGQTVIVEGEVRRVCKKMGCWMELATAKDDAAASCRVFFGAHQFFVPKDSDGASARVQGEVQVQQVEASFVQHLEEEGASFKAKNDDGTAQEVRLVASGVELERS